MMKRRFKKVMSYFFNFDSINTPRKKSRKAASTGGLSRKHLENESQYVIRKLNENPSPRENVSFSRYTPLPRIGEAVESKSGLSDRHGDTSTSHIITYKFSPVRVSVPPKVSYQLSPLPIGDTREMRDRTDHAREKVDNNHSRERERTYSSSREKPDNRSKEWLDDHSVQKIDNHQSEWLNNNTKESTDNPSKKWPSNHSRDWNEILSGERNNQSKDWNDVLSRERNNNQSRERRDPSQARPRLKRQGTYVVRDPVFIKGSFLEYLKHNDNMVTTRIHPPSEKKSRSTSKRTANEPKHSVAKVSNSKQRLNEIKAKFKRQQEELKAKEQEQAFWLEL